MFRYLLLSALLATPVIARGEPGNCIVVDGQYILARNLASAYPEFLSLEGEMTLSYAPAPGSRRTVSAAEVSGWAQSHDLTAHARQGACFERASVTLTIEDYRRAIADQLKGSKGATEIDVLDFYSHVLPLGRLELPVAGAALPSRDHPEAPFLWRGHFISSAGAPYPVWARVRIFTNGNVVRAVQNLPAGTILESQQLTSSPEPCSPFRTGDSEPVSFYVGKSLTRSAALGSRVDSGQVQDPPTVHRGDKVRVVVVSGSTRLELEALADSAGYVGDSILLKNPSGSRSFRALVTGYGRAEILLNGGGAKGGIALQMFASKGSS